MTTYLTARCGCGRSIQRPASLAEVPAVAASFEAQGWGYSPPPQCFVRCPSCLSGETSPSTVAPTPRAPQGDLFPPERK